MTPAMQAAAQGAAGPNGSMLGCFTLVKKQGAAAGTATATGRVGRSRAATAAGRAAAAAGDGQDTAIVIMTDGESAAKYALWITALSDTLPGVELTDVAIGHEHALCGGPARFGD